MIYERAFNANDDRWTNYRNGIMRDDSSFELIRDAFAINALSLIQVCMFIILYDAIVDVYVSYAGPMNRIFAFGQQLDYGLWLLCICAGLNSAAQVLIRQRWICLAAPTIAAILWLSYWSNIADEVPNRYLLLSTLGMASFLCGVLLAPKKELTPVYLK